MQKRHVFVVMKMSLYYLALPFSSPLTGRNVVRGALELDRRPQLAFFDGRVPDLVNRMTLSVLLKDYVIAKAFQCKKRDPMSKFF